MFLLWKRKRWKYYHEHIGVQAAWFTMQQMVVRIVAGIVAWCGKYAGF